jgi:hypothetical protein
MKNEIHFIVRAGLNICGPGAIQINGPRAIHICPSGQSCRCVFDSQVAAYKKCFSQ